MGLAVMAGTEIGKIFGAFAEKILQAAAMRGKKHSAETRARMSETHKRRFALDRANHEATL
jgi:hypothetical protein